MNMKTKKVNWKQLTIRLPEDVHRALKVRVAEEGRNMGELVEGLVRRYLVTGATPDGQVTVGGRNRKLVASLAKEYMAGDAVGRADLPGGGVMVRGKTKVGGKKA